MSGGGEGGLSIVDRCECGTVKTEVVKERSEWSLPETSVSPSNVKGLIRHQAESSSASVRFILALDAGPPGYIHSCLSPIPCPSHSHLSPLVSSPSPSPSSCA